MALVYVSPGYDAAAMSSPEREAEDLDDFRAAMTGVQPLTKSDRLPPPRARPSTRPRQAEADERAVMDELLDYGMFEPELIESGDTLIYRGAGLQDSVWRKLRRGGYRLRAELDLHGMNRADARLAVSDFIAECQARDARCVRIIHGKGNRSPNSGPVIKTLLDSWLRRRNDVIAFCSARPHDGGTGAVYVLLRAAGSGA
jgi:DNA-nicking Smr family endonuclease